MNYDLEFGLVCLISSFGFILGFIDNYVNTGSSNSYVGAWVCAIIMVPLGMFFLVKGIKKSVEDKKNNSDRTIKSCEDYNQSQNNIEPVIDEDNDFNKTYDIATGKMKILKGVLAIILILSIRGFDYALEPAEICFFLAICVLIFSGIMYLIKNNSKRK